MKHPIRVSIKPAAAQIEQNRRALSGVDKVEKVVGSCVGSFERQRCV